LEIDDKLKQDYDNSYFVFYEQNIFLY